MICTLGVMAPLSLMSPSPATESTRAAFTVIVIVRKPAQNAHSASARVAPRQGNDIVPAEEVAGWREHKPSRSRNSIRISGFSHLATDAWDGKPLRGKRVGRCSSCRRDRERSLVGGGTICARASGDGLSGASPCQVLEVFFAADIAVCVDSESSPDRDWATAVKAGEEKTVHAKEDACRRSEGVDGERQGIRGVGPGSWNRGYDLRRSLDS